MPKIDRRTVLTGILGATCLAAEESRGSKLENTFYDPVNKDFTLGFKFRTAFELVTDNKSIFLKMVPGNDDEAELSLEIETYLKKYKSKPVKFSYSKTVENEVVLTWDSREFSVFINTKKVAAVSVRRRSTRHAVPLLKNFESFSSPGVIAGSIKSCNRKIEPDKVAAFFSNPIKNVEGSIIGPCVGQVSDCAASLWIRGTEQTNYILSLWEGGNLIKEDKQQSSYANDLAVKWVLSGLKEDCEYSYKISGKGSAGQLHKFKTTGLSNDKSTRILFGSCASLDNNSLYEQIDKLKPEVIAFMGDTPYIDTGILEVHRHSHREFFRIKPIAKALTSTSCISTWDDHDFGTNNCDGKFAYKNNSFKAFKEYRAQLSYGNNTEGIYTSYRNGSVEVFMLDCRWFSYTGNSTVKGSHQKTLLGKEQWTWLFKALKESTAVFKILACGIIWDDKMNREKDDWETYSDERKKLFDFIKHEKINGVVLLGGDIHVSRHLRYPETKVGYPLHQFISSPMHEGVIKSLNTKHESLQWSALQKNTFLIVETEKEGDSTLLSAKYMNDQGRVIHKVAVNSKTLKHR